MQANESSAHITVQGVTPGIGYVISGAANQHTSSGFTSMTVASVNVFDCSAGATLAPPFAAVEGKLNEQVFLKVTPSVEGGTFQWYWGPRGDGRNPISFTNAPYYIDFVPRKNGSYPFWVRHTSVCGVAEAAVTVNVGVQHRRGVGR
ncbi:MAG: hypothetical protein JWO56_713 [Acidobacteria bacterium]|nr:hypothetical protein [Acidobacteriota bacterium]